MRDYVILIVQALNILANKGGKTKCDKTYDGINQRKCL